MAESIALLLNQDLGANVNNVVPHAEQKSYVKPQQRDQETQVNGVSSDINDNSSEAGKQCCSSLNSSDIFKSSAEAEDIHRLRRIIVNSLPRIIGHASKCKSQSKACRLNSYLLQYFLAREFEYLKEDTDGEELTQMLPVKADIELQDDDKPEQRRELQDQAAKAVDEVIEALDKNNSNGSSKLSVGYDSDNLDVLEHAQR